jgi:hypothetical protein
MPLFCGGVSTEDEGAFKPLALGAAIASDFAAPGFPILLVGAFIREVTGRLLIVVFYLVYLQKSGENSYILTQIEIENMQYFSYTLDHTIFDLKFHTRVKDRAHIRR